MTSITLERCDVIVGVDTHKDQHAAVALDGLGGDLDNRVVVATNGGYAELVAWALGLGQFVAFGGRLRLLRRQGRNVIEVSRRPRHDARRLRRRSPSSAPPVRCAARCRGSRGATPHPLAAR